MLLAIRGVLPLPFPFAVLAVFLVLPLLLSAFLFHALSVTRIFLPIQTLAILVASITLLMLRNRTNGESSSTEPE
jgi:hypothetical protein